MTILFIILVIILYLLIGSIASIIVGILDDTNGDFFVVLFWPILIVFVPIAIIWCLLEYLTGKLTNYVLNKIRKE